MKHMLTFESYINESYINESVTEDEMNAAIALMDKTAKVAGFKLYKKNKSICIKKI